MSIKITILDEINCHFDGLTEDQISHIIEETKITEKGAFMKASFKMKLWDGKVSHFSEEGFTFTFLISKVLDALDQYGVDLSDVEIIDERQKSPIPDDLEIDENFIKEETGFTLREHQLSSINSALKYKKGVIDASMNAGKSNISLAITKALNPYIGVIYIVPNEVLANDAYNLYKKSGLDVLLLTAKVPAKKRESLIESHRHIIITSKLLLTSIKYFSEKQFAFILDEAHIFGDRLAEVLKFDLNNCPFRLAMTGTLPKSDPLKLEKIFCHIGGKVLERVSARYLIDENFSSDFIIKIYQVKEIDEMKDLATSDIYDYSIELNYTNSHGGRVESIARFIQSLEKKNTLIICSAEFGQRLSTELGVNFIHEETRLETRMEWLDPFHRSGEEMLVATFKTGSTGISRDHIYRVILIDSGISESTVLQSIGRGSRKGENKNFFEVIDIGSDLKYGKKHTKKRISMYKRESYNFVKIKEKIEVEY